MQVEPQVTCEVHGVATQLCAVPVQDGMCVVPRRGYLEALLTRFPNSYWQVLSCSCVSFGTIHVIRHVCPACRAAERLWRARQEWSLEDEEGC